MRTDRLGPSSGKRSKRGGPILANPPRPCKHCSSLKKKEDHLPTSIAKEGARKVEGWHIQHRDRSFMPTTRREAEMWQRDQERCDAAIPSGGRISPATMVIHDGETCEPVYTKSEIEKAVERVIDSMPDTLGVADYQRIRDIFKFL